MAIEVGARLDPYEIEEVIGAGGMGEVYRARDTRLERMVAIMREQPQPVSAVQPMIQPAFDHVIQSCLGKDLEARWQTICDADGYDRSRNTEL